MYISSINIELPPLRSRGAAILLLAGKFVEHFSSRQDKAITGLSDTTSEKLLEYTWPGNVRELRNAIEHAVALSRFDTIMPEDLPEKIHLFRNNYILLGAEVPMELISMEEMERRDIMHVLKTTGGNRTLTARILQVDRKTLYRNCNSMKDNEQLLLIEGAWAAKGA